LRSTSNSGKKTLHNASTSKPLLKALTEVGIGSRRRLADAIRQGRVQVNGQVVDGFGYPLNIGIDRVQVDGRLVDIKPEPLIYLIMNKPKDVLSTTSDERGRRTVAGMLPEKYRRFRLYPVGRLDKDSTGIILLTNDGELTNKLTHPRYEHEKEYLVQINSSIKPDERKKLEKGLHLEDGLTYPAVVRGVNDCPPFNYRITIHEGRKRQVRRMFQSLGYHVQALKRVRIGSLTLGKLEEGEIRELDAREKRVLLSNK